MQDGNDGNGDRDAFGQPVRAESAAATPVLASVPPSAAAAPAEQVERAPRRSFVPLLFTIAAIAVTALVLYRADHDALDSPAVLGRELAGHALGPQSLVRSANFERALGAVRAEMAPGEELLSLRLVPDELSTTVRDANGNTRLIDVGIDLDVDARDWSTDTSSTPLDIAALDPAAPQRVVRGALREAGADDTHLSYASLSGGEPPTWYVSLEDVPIAEQAWTADLAGIAVTHPGELPFAEGLTGRSLLREANFAAALEKIGEHGRRVTSLRIAPDRIDADLRGDGGTRDVQVDAAQRVIVRESPGSASSGSMRIDQIDPAAPGRAFAAAAKQGGLSPAKIDYAVLSIPPPAIGGAATWSLFFKDVAQRKTAWRADADGRQVEHIG